MLITVSGPPGSGKTTLAGTLAARLGHEHISGGDIFRAMAAERDMSVLEFNRLAEEDDSIDRELDRRLREFAIEREDLVLESRLAGWMAGRHADLRLWLDAPLDVRAARIAAREDEASLETVRERTQARAESEAARYRAYYGIDIEDRSIYDLAVNTARWGEDAVSERVADWIEAYDPSEDEGQVDVVADYDFDG